MVTSFAPDYSRNNEGWIMFPKSDIEYRREMFPDEVNKHSAKANLYLMQEIIKYVSEPGNMLLDPMAGTGSLLIALLVGRSVVCIEISPTFHQIQQVALQSLEKIEPGIAVNASLINSPCQLALPMPGLADHIIFSPPYAGILKSKGTDTLTMERTTYDFEEYTFSHPQNLGLMNDFLWGQEMEKVYKKCYETLKPGGSMTIIVKDHMEKRKRVGLTNSAVNACIRVGFTQDPEERFKWEPPGHVYTSIYKARGWEVVLDEDIVVLRKA